MPDPTISELAARLSCSLATTVTVRDILNAAAALHIPLRDGRVPEREAAAIYLEVQRRVRARSQMQEVIEDYFTFEAAACRP